MFENQGLTATERKWVERALKRGALTSAQVKEAVEAREATDPSAPLEVVLVSMGLLQEPQLEALGRTTRRIPILAPTDETGEVVQIYGSCTVLEPMARGPSGTVYRAVHGDTGEKVALKLIPANALNRPFLRAFSRNLQLALGLSHPRAARVFDAGVQGTTLYVATELLGGPTLLEIVRENGPLVAERASALLAQVAGALRAAHGIGLIHGNLKPENVFLSGKLDVKVTDFGLGRADAGFLAQHADKAGTLVYSLAPEQWSRETVPASDFYACGVLWYYMLTGKYPFEGRSYQEIRRKHERTEPPAPSAAHRGVPSSADALARKLLEKDPARRLASADGLLQALQAFDSRKPTRRTRKPR
jgi:serine/threonine-protein kinase